MKNLFLFIIIPVLLVLCGRSSAQTTASYKIYGKVTDSISKKPLAAAIITLSGSGPVQNNLTQTDGSFNISGLKPGKYQLAVKSVGYLAKSFTVNVRVDTSLTVSLAPDVKSLSEVTVKSSRPLIQQNS